jgi:hypothetical protein
MTYGSLDLSPRAVLFTFLMGLGVLLSHAALADMAPPALPTPAQIHDMIAAVGATKAVGQLYQKGQYDEIMDKMGGGQSEWIALAPALAEGTDADTSEELSISLALALPINPEAVLQVLTIKGTSPLAAQAVCSAPFIEDTVADIPAYIKKAEGAVKTAKATDVREQQAVCLDVLKQAATMPTNNP